MLEGTAKGFPGILYGIYTGSRTGELVITAGDDVRRVFFFKGRPVSVIESRTSEPLGRVLLEMGIILQEHYDKSLIEMAKTGRKQGEILIEMGYVTAEQLEMALFAQLRKKLNRIFFLKEFSYAFNEGEEHIKPAGDFASSPKVATLAVIYHGIKNSMKETELDRVLGLDSVTAFRLSGDYWSMSFSLPLSPEEVIVAEHMNTSVTLDQLVGLRVLTRTEILMLVYYLSLLDLVEFERGAAGPGPTTDDSRLTTQPSPRPTADRPPPGSLDLPNSGSEAVMATDILIPEEAVTLPPQPARPPSQELFAAASPAPPSPAEDAAAMREMVERFTNIHQMDYYQILDIGKDADETAVRRAYFELMRRYHPMNLSTNEEEALHVAKILKVKANEAYTTLASPNLRVEYDRAISEAAGRQGQAGQRAGEAELEYHKGDFFLRKGDFRNALASFKRALELYGQQPDFVAAYGWALYHDPDQHEDVRRPMGRQYLRKAVVLNPNCTRAFVHLASVARLEGKLDEAEKYLAEASKLDADHELVGPERDAIAEARRQPGAAPKATQARIEKKGFFSKILGGNDEK
jgi:tetratricopeptide (TPR) repeat protein